MTQQGRDDSSERVRVCPGRLSATSELAVTVVKTWRHNIRGHCLVLAPGSLSSGRQSRLLWPGERRAQVYECPI